MSTLTQRIRTPILLTSLASLACCGGGEATDQDYNDVALAVGSMVAGSDNQGESVEMSETVMLSQGQTPSGLTRSGDGTVDGQRGTLSYSFSVSCLDASGAAQDACDETTDEAQVNVAWNGEIDWPRYSATVDRTGDWNLSNIQSGVAELNGQGTFEIDSEFLSLDGKRMRTFKLSYAADYQGVLVDVDTRSIQGGTANYDILARRTASNSFRDVEAELDIEATVTFHGDGTATLELDGSRSYNIDLTSGTVVRM